MHFNCEVGNCIFLSLILVIGSTPKPGVVLAELEAQNSAQCQSKAGGVQLHVGVGNKSAL